MALLHSSPLVLMPPKLNNADINEKLRELRAYVIANQEDLSARRDITLGKTLKQDKSKEEGSHYQFLHKANKQNILSQHQKAHLQETFALLQPANAVATTTSSSSSSVAPVPVSDQAQDAHDYASPKRRKNNLVSVHISGNEVARSKFKRKSSEGTCIESGAIPPTRRTRPRKTNKHPESFQETLTGNHWAEMHEFNTWLSTPEAKNIRQEEVHKDTQAVQHLLIYPPFRNLLATAGEHFGVKRLGSQSVVLWHHRCVEAALQRFRWWKKGGFLKLFQQES